MGATCLGSKKPRKDSGKILLEFSTLWIAKVHKGLQMESECRHSSFWKSAIRVGKFFFKLNLLLFFFFFLGKRRRINCTFHE